MKFKRTAISTAMALAMVAGSAQADIVFYDWTGTFTMIDPGDVTTPNSDAAAGTPATNPLNNGTKGHQTAISGTMVFNTDQNPSSAPVTTTFNGQSITLGPGGGSATVGAFNFFGSGPAVAHDITMQAIGDGVGGPGTLVSGNMLFDWNNNNNINVDIVFDAAGFFTAAPVPVGSALALGSGAVAPDYESRCIDVSFGVCTIALDDPAAGATSWVDQNTGLIVNDASQFGLTTFVTGGPRFMSTIDGSPGVSESVTITSAGADGILGTADDVTWTGNRHSDGLSGIRMDNGPFPGFNANFDVDGMTLTAHVPVNPIPVPAAVWLFGSGLLGLVGVARRKKIA